MQIISWNVASIRARLPLLLHLLAEKQPDIVFLQEIKATEDTFPFDALKKAGYFAYIHGQKSFNGVAVLSKKPLEVKELFVEGLYDDQARFIAVGFEKTLFVCVYAPNGAPPMNNPADNSRLLYKLSWYESLKQTLENYLNQGFSVVLGGDFNVIESDEDVYDPDVFRFGPLMVPPVRKAFQQITNLPFLNTIKAVPHPKPLYSYWDFQMLAFQRNSGILLDFIFIPNAWKQNLIQAGVYRAYRKREKPSDHAPVYCLLNDSSDS